MGLLTKEVEVSINPKNINHYLKLGYKIEKILNKNGKYLYWGSKIIVKVNDLTKGSSVKVKIECDLCKIVKEWRWVDYLKQEKGGKTYCKKCNNTFTDRRNITIIHRKPSIKNTISFEEWCLDNNRQDILDRWDYELNDYKPNEISYGTRIKYYFKCSRGIHKSELKTINCFTSGQEGSLNCNQCNSFAQWGIDNICEDFLEKYWDYKKNIAINPWDVSRGSRTKKVWIKCQEKDYHGSYEILPNSFTSESNRCPYCHNVRGKVHPLDSLGKLLEDKDLLHLWSDKNKKSPYEYTPYSAQKVWWKCFDGKHADYLKVINNATNADYRCPQCSQEKNESILQEKVRLYLNKLHYIILHEHNCTIVPKNPKTNYQLPFDNEIKELKLIIEVHGKQHYEDVGGYMGLDFKYRKIRDRYKRILAKMQGYYYLEIPYKADNKSSQWKTLIDNKINYIKQQENKEIS